MRLTVDRYIAVEGCNFRFPAVAAAVRSNFIAVIIENQIAVDISSTVGMIDNDVVTGEVRIIEAKMDIALRMNLQWIYINFSGIACYRYCRIICRKLYENISLQVIYTCERIKGRSEERR